MLSKQHLIGMLVGLKRINNLEAVYDNSVLNQICLSADRQFVQRMAEIVNELYDTFDYQQSPEFHRLIAGKSAAYRAMRERLVVQNKADNLLRFSQALENIGSSDEALELLDPGRHEHVRQLRNLLDKVTNHSHQK